LLTSRGTIRLDVAPEESALDFTAGLTIQGFTVPGLATRRVETEVELASGQSFAIGGLLDRRLTETIQKVPLLDDIPQLGKLFQSKAKSTRNNELLVIITPEIVRPAQPGQIQQLKFSDPNWAGAAVTPGGPAIAGQAPAQADRVPVERLTQQLKNESEMKLQQGTTLSTWPGAAPLPAMTPAQSAPPATPATPAAPPAAPAPAPAPPPK
jgi:pilus assembly protein CpaC